MFLKMSKQTSNDTLPDTNINSHSLNIPSFPLFFLISFTISKTREYFIPR